MESQTIMNAPTGAQIVLYSKTIAKVAVRAAVRVSLHARRAVNGWIGNLLCRKSAAIRNYSTQPCVTLATAFVSND